MRQILPAFVLLVFTAAVLGQNTSALINKALDAPVNIKYKDPVRLTELMEKITAETGVRLVADPAVWDLLPWGEDTKVQARIENRTLREALKAITRTFGLTFALRDEYVEIQPMPALRRLAQRASVEELKALDFLASTPMGLETDRPTIKQLLEAVDLKLAGEKELQIAVENRLGEDYRPAGPVGQDKSVFVPRNATMMEALDSLPKDTRATWYPWGKSVMIVSKEDRARRLLSKPLTIRADRGKALLQTLTDIATQTGVSFEYQPGFIQSLPVEARTIHGTFDNVPAQEILQHISAATGLVYTYRPEDDKMYISAAASIPTRPTPPRDPIVGMVQLDNGFQVLVPASQVPEDLREYLRYKTIKELEKIREMMVEEGFKPTTQPTTQPSPDL